MRGGIDCGRAEELFSDHHEGTLEDLLRADLEAHLAECERCRDLRAALGEVVEALRNYPVLDPPADLAGRAAATAFGRASRLASPLRSAGGLTGWVFAAVASILIVTTAALLLVHSRGPGRSLRRLTERAANAAIYVAERKDRFVEDFRILKVVVGTAFEGRLDRVNDRMDDYRRLLERRRKAEQEQKKSRGARDVSPAVRSARLVSLPNPERAELVGCHDL